MPSQTLENVQSHPGMVTSPPPQASDPDLHNIPKKLGFFLIPSLNLTCGCGFLGYGVTQYMALSSLPLSLDVGPLCPNSSQGFSSLCCVPALAHLSSHPLSSPQCPDTTQEFKLEFCNEHWKLPTRLDAIRV